jgi:hypothetical protein
MNKTQFALLGLAVCGVITSTIHVARAGYKIDYPLYVSADRTTFQGNIGLTRNSANTTEYVWCHVTVPASQSYASCGARDANGRFAGCYTYDARKIALLNSIQGDEYIWVSIYGTTGECGDMTLEKGSQYSPKGH